MSTLTQPHFVHEMRGEGAPPRSNGELIFNEPWEGRAFGIAVALSQAGHYSWDAFRARLIEAIGRWQRKHPRDPANEHEPATCGQPGWSYYEQWLIALEGLLLEEGMVDQEELERRTHEFMTTRRDEAFY